MIYRIEIERKNSQGRVDDMRVERSERYESLGYSKINIYEVSVDVEKFQSDMTEKENQVEVLKSQLLNIDGINFSKVLDVGLNYSPTEIRGEYNTELVVSENARIGNVISNEFFVRIHSGIKGSYASQVGKNLELLWEVKKGKGVVDALIVSDSQDYEVSESFKASLMDLLKNEGFKWDMRYMPSPKKKASNPQKEDKEEELSPFAQLLKSKLG